MLIDAHTHLYVGGPNTLDLIPDNQQAPQLAHWLSRQQLQALVNATSSQEYQLIKKLAAKVSFGLHPWQAQLLETEAQWFEKHESFFADADAVGEIGMDSVWCQLPLDLQEKVFQQQLVLAEAFKKPIVLHTAGQEKTVGQIIQDYPFKKLVHWYTDECYLDLYRKADAYFTLGVDLCENPRVQTLAKAIPLDRLLLETDGYDGLVWAKGQSYQYADTVRVLEENLAYLAQIKSVSISTLEKQLEENFYGFLG